jgi:hypothetical protein
MSTRGARVGAALVLLVGTGCDRGQSKASPEASVAADASRPAAASTRAGDDAAPSATTGRPSTRAPASAGGEGSVPPCKVMSSEGGPSATADATRWLDVAASANFTVRTLETGRELRFEGPGRIRPCGDDVALVAEGSAVGLPGSGEAPGAEQWAATACGVARWASGVHRVTGGRAACSLHSSMGAAHLWVADDVQVDDAPVDGGAADAAAHAATTADGGPGASPWRRVDAKRALRLRGSGPLDSATSARRALASCEKAAENVQRLATRMSAGDAGDGNLGELAAASVGARGVARAACAVAAVRVALAGSGPADQARLDLAISRWRVSRREAHGAQSKGD